MLAQLTAASSTVVADVFAEVVCPLLDGGRIQGVSREQQTEAAEMAEELSLLQTTQLHAAMSTLPGPEVTYLVPHSKGIENGVLNKLVYRS